MSNLPPERPEEPGDDALARMFAEEESSIYDNGFSRRVVDQASDGIGWRRTAVYGAGMAGFGVAVASMIDLAPHLPAMSAAGQRRAVTGSAGRASTHSGWAR